MQFSLPRAHRIVAIEEDNYRTKTFVLDGTLHAYAGQFVMLWLPGFDEKPFSLVNANPITIMVTEVGPFTSLLHQHKRVGDQLWIRGPFGSGYSLPSSQSKIALVGGGYGVAPLYWLARCSLPNVQRINVIIGARVARDVLYVPRFQNLQAEQPDKVQIIITTEDGSRGQSGRVTDVLQRLLLSESPAVNSVYACGPHGMLAAIESLCRTSRIAGQLSWEAYMRCAVGICGSCEHDGWMLCLDGPVLYVGESS